MLTLTFISQVICVWCTDTDRVAHLTTYCLEMPLCMSKSVNILLNTKICCMLIWGGSPPVNLVILDTDWCWCTDTDKELHLSSYWWSQYLACLHRLILNSTLQLQNYFSHNLGPSIVKLCTDIYCVFNYHICCLVPMLYVTPVVCLQICHGTCPYIVYIFYVQCI